MTNNRRKFLQLGAVAAAGAAAGIPNRSGGGTLEAATAVSALIQFSGLILHGRKPGSTAYEFQGWDALLVQSATHVPHLRIPLANVKNPQPYHAKHRPLGFHKDRWDPYVGIWHLRSTDVTVKLDGTTSYGRITGSTGRVSGTKCPDSNQDAEYEDITWVLDLQEAFGDGTINPGLAGAPKDFPAGLVRSRFRLPEGTIASARPSVADADKMLVHFGDSTKGHFAPDILRHTVKAPAIEIVITPFATGAAETLELVGTVSAPAFVRVENHDPTLAQRAIQKLVDATRFWDEHFKPYAALMKMPPGQIPIPTLDCCPGESCDPPFYCIPPGGTFT